MSKRLKVVAVSGGLQRPSRTLVVVERLLAALGDALPIDDVKFNETPEGKRRALAHQAKDARKARRGERRGRSKP